MQQYSWNQLDNDTIVKSLDYSAFSDRSSGIPKQFYPFFKTTYTRYERDITLKYKNISYYAKIVWKNPNNSRAVISWNQNLSALMKYIFPSWTSINPHDKDSKLGLVFHKTENENSYEISFKRDNSEMTFGHIEGINEGHIFASRDLLRLSGIHAPPEAGIWGRQDEGSASIVLSGGYADDIDDWDYIFYTGQGGRDPSSGKQIKDQEFTLGNKGLQLNKEYNHSVRVIRGYQVEEGPDEGYRYDGLYYVTGYERVKGKEGFLVCRFHLQKEKKGLPSEGIEHPTSPSERIEYRGNRLKRNVKYSEQIKKMYNFTCQVCKVFLKTPNEGYGIAEAAHIQAMGKPHEGPDTKSNMICLCPNHHAQFDRFSFYIEPETLEIIGLDEFKGKSIKINSKHKVKSEYFEYQKQQYLKNN